jgi:hypothetical protein
MEGSTVGASGASVATASGINLSLIQPTGSAASRAGDQRSSLTTIQGSRSPMNLDIMSDSAPVTVSRNTSLIPSTPATSTERASMNYNITGAAQNLATQGTFPTIDQGALNTYLRMKAQADAEKAAEAKKAAMLSAGNTLKIGPGFTYTRTGSSSGQVATPEVEPVRTVAATSPTVVVVDEEPFYKHPAFMVGGGILLLLGAGYAIYKAQGN